MKSNSDSGFNVRFDEPAARLAEAYAPCFTLALQLRATNEFGDAAMLRQRIKDLLEKTRKEAIASGLPPEDVREAEFALVAFIDETVLSSDWSQKDQWISNPLQLELFNRYDAGEEFFQRLDGLRANSRLHAEAIEVYYLCMALGFKGRYQLHGQEELRHLIEETHAELAKQPGMQLGALAPHGKPRGQAATEVRGKWPAWALLSAAAVLALFVYLCLSFLISGSADNVADDIDSMAGSAVEVSR